MGYKVRFPFHSNLTGACGTPVSGRAATASASARSFGTTGSRVVWFSPVKLLDSGRARDGVTNLISRQYCSDSGLKLFAGGLTLLLRIVSSSEIVFTETIFSSCFCTRR